MIVTKIAFTVAIVSAIAALVGRGLDSPFRSIITPWTYVSGLGVIFFLAALPISVICFIWGV
jgi:hypothetical protein